MFGKSYFGATYYGGSYWGKGLNVPTPTPTPSLPSISGGGGAGMSGHLRGAKKRRAMIEREDAEIKQFIKFIVPYLARKRR